MKILSVPLAIVGCLLFNSTVIAQHQVYLRGIVNIPGQQIALLQIDHETWTVHPGYNFKRSNGQGSFRFNALGFSVLQIDCSNEIIKTRIDGNEYTNTLPSQGRPATAKSWIHLKNADFKRAMDLFGILSDRIVLLHPKVNISPFSCEGVWTNPAPSKAEFLTCFAHSLTQRDAIALEDGDCFLQVIPSTMAQTINLGAKDLPSTKTDVPNDVSELETMTMYGGLVASAYENDPMGTVPYFKATRPLSKAQAIYAFKTIFHWSGKEIDLNEINKFNTMFIPSPQK